jgi:membrane dipeptidase
MSTPLEAVPAQPPVMREPISEIAEGVHRSALVIDGHADTPQRMLDDGYDLAAPLGDGHLNLTAAREGSLGAEFFVSWVEPDRFPGQFARRSLELIDAVHQAAARHPDRMMLAYSPEDIERAGREQKLAALIAIEGGHAIENSLGVLREYYRLGARYMTLTWTNSNGWADSSGDIDTPKTPHTEDGLTEFGCDVIREMNRLGMMVDISHVSDKTFYRVLETSRAPIFASHSSARALTQSARNLTDEMLRAVAQSGGPGSQGGLTMVNFYSAFLSESWRQAWQALDPEVEAARAAQMAQWQAAGMRVTREMICGIYPQWTARIPRPPFSVLIDRIDHIARVAGVDHVGLGSDFDGIASLPEGIDSAADLPKITAALLERGYSAEDCRKILGGNFLRFFREVEEFGRRRQSDSR